MLILITKAVIRIGIILMGLVLSFLCGFMSLQMLGQGEYIPALVLALLCLLMVILLIRDVNKTQR